jgi:spermidine/putrescine-binding protein
MQRALEYRLTRRSLLKGAGAGIAGISLASLLAACGSDGGGNGGGEAPAPADVFSGEPGDELNFANWPAYMDQAKDKDGNVYHPTLRTFEEQTGITVNYQDVINDNAEFFGRIQPLLAGGDDPGWDLMVITNGRYFTALTNNGWVYELDPSKRPNFDANAASWAKDPFYDPGNKFGMAWQSGVTGIGVNTKLVNGPITKMDDLANPDKVGTSSVGMLEGDMAEWVMINLGIDPVTSGPDEWREAAAWLQMQKESGTVRAYYGNDYLPGLVRRRPVLERVAGPGHGVRLSRGRGTDLDRQHDGAGGRAERGRGSRGHGFLLRPRERDQADGVDPVHVARPRDAEAHPGGRRQELRPGIQGVCEEARGHGQQPVPVPGRGVPVADIVRLRRLDGRDGAGMGLDLPAHLSKLSRKT